MAELRYVVRRLLGLIPLLLAITFIVFLVMENTPGDPVELRLGQNATREAVEATRAELGLDDPLLVQYVHFVGDLVTGDLGQSIRNDRPVLDEVASAGRVSVVLAGSAMLIATVVGMGVGILSALRPNSLLDNVLRVGVLAAVSMPVFWLGLVLISNVSVKLGWLPSFGWGSPSKVVLPAITLATFPLAVIARMTRSAMLEVMSSDFIRTVRANGLPERTIVLKYGLQGFLQYQHTFGLDHIDDRWVAGGIRFEF